MDFTVRKYVRDCENSQNHGKFTNISVIDFGDNLTLVFTFSFVCEQVCETF